MRTLSRGALAVVLSITGLAAPMAASAALSRAQLEDLEHHLWQVRTDYHMYAVMDGNDTYRVALNEAAQQAAEALDELRAASESDAERALVADLADQDHVRVLSQRGPQGVVELQGVQPHFPMPDQ